MKQALDELEIFGDDVEIELLEIMFPHLNK